MTKLITKIIQKLKLIKKNIKQVLGYAKRTIIKCISLLKPKSSRRKILLICNSPTMGEHLSAFEKVFIQDGLIDVSIYVQKESNCFTEEIWKEVTNWFNGKLVGRILAQWFPWDLIVCPDHGIASFFDNHISPMLYIGHGAWNKVLEKDHILYTISSYGYNKRGRWRYKKMFCCSHYIQTAAEEDNPDVKGLISVVGDLQLDQLLKLSEKRNSIRSEFDICHQKTLVMLLGSWGSDSLFHKYGDFLLKEALKLIPKGYHFIINIHPNEYTTQSEDGRIWGTYLESFCNEHCGFIMRDQKENSNRYLVASDLIISDHTCLADAALLLEIPLMVTPVDLNRIWDKSITSLSRKIAPHLSCDYSLEEQLNNLNKNYPFHKMRIIAENMLSYRFMASDKIKAETYKMLKINTRV